MVGDEVRTRPYIDVTRAKCGRCGAPGEYEWSGVCAERKSKVIYHALCGKCDREGNEMLLKWFYGVGKAAEIMKGYE
jgi:hypothetical protein